MNYKGIEVRLTGLITLPPRRKSLTSTWCVLGNANKAKGYNMAGLLTLERLRTQEAEASNSTAIRNAVRDKLYHNFRYATGSYKARKAMIRPFLMTARRGASMLRLHDDGSHQPTKNQEAAATTKFAGWRAKERELKQLQMPAYKKWLKNNRLTAKNNPFSYWLINIATSSSGTAP